MNSAKNSNEFGNVALGKRRVVTGMRNGKSIFLSDAATPNNHSYVGWPGFYTSVMWATAKVPSGPLSERDETAFPGQTITPAPGETRLMIVKFPPDSVFESPGFDPARLQTEQALHIPGLVECFEKQDPGMHRTSTIDYDIVLDGEIWLELDDGQEKHLKHGDVVIQGGTRHAWRNKSSGITTMAFVLIGATS